MKKLLLTLGTVAAVAAPVASVIACGSNGSESETGKTLTTKSLVAALAARGYSTSDEFIAKIMSELASNADTGAATKFTFGKIANGQLAAVEAHNTLHDADDFLIIVKGGKPKDPTDVDAGVALDFTPGASQTSKTATGDFASHWGSFTTDDFKGATSIIYLHHADDGGINTFTKSSNATIVINGVNVKDGKVYELPNPEAISQLDVTYKAPTA